MQAVIFVGVQGAGKSTFYKERFFRTHVRISLDLLNKSRWREGILLQAVIDARQPFVVDNTNPDSAVRKKYVELAKAAGFELVAYYFDVSFDDAMARNSARDEVERIPEVGLKSVLKTMQKPSADEGFDKVFRVQVTVDGFIVEPETSKS